MDGCNYRTGKVCVECDFPPPPSVPLWFKLQHPALRAAHYTVAEPSSPPAIKSRCS